MNWPSDTALAGAAVVAALLAVRYELAGIRRAMQRLTADRPEEPTP